MKIVLKMFYFGTDLLFILSFSSSLRLLLGVILLAVIICGWLRLLSWLPFLPLERIGNGASRKKMSALATEIDSTPLIYSSFID